MGLRERPRKQYGKGSCCDNKTAVLNEHKAVFGDCTIIQGDSGSFWWENPGGRETAGAVPCVAGFYRFSRGNSRQQTRQATAAPMLAQNTSRTPCATA